MAERIPKRNRCACFTDVGKTCIKNRTEVFVLEYLEQTRVYICKKGISEYFKQRVLFDYEHAPFLIRRA